MPGVQVYENAVYLFGERQQQMAPTERMLLHPSESKRGI